MLEVFVLCSIILVIHILNLQKSTTITNNTTDITTNDPLLPNNEDVSENPTDLETNFTNDNPTKPVTDNNNTSNGDNLSENTTSNNNHLSTTINPAVTYTRSNHDTTLRNNANAINLNVNVVYQLPELPTGCEITALTMTLNYYGYNIDKITLADNYLEKGTIGIDSYKKVFLGDPHNKNAYGCFAPVIVDSANKYLIEQQSTLHAFDLTGLELNELFEEIRYGNPIIIWGSLNPNITIQYNKTWVVDSEILKWPANEHCMVLTGFDLDNNTVTICDPLKGVCVYDYNAFLEYYVELGRQAVILDTYN